MTSEDRLPGALIADAVDRLRCRGINVDATPQAGMTMYLVERPTYQANIVVDPARWLGVEFVLFSHDRGADLRHWVDTDLYNISLDKNIAGMPRRSRPTSLCCSTGRRRERCSSTARQRAPR